MVALPLISLLEATEGATMAEVVSEALEAAAPRPEFRVPVVVVVVIFEGEAVSVLAGAVVVELLASTELILLMLLFIVAEVHEL